MERTYIMLKPDCMTRGLTGEIISRIERRGYRITNAKFVWFDEKLCEEHYAHCVGKPWYAPTLEYMTSGPSLAMIVEGENVIKGMRLLMGPTKFGEAQPGTIRGDYATSNARNLIHGSDSPEAAEIEIKRFFGENA